jgi:hypothetical protein
VCKHYAKSFYYRARPYKRRSGYSFTLVVVYDLTEDGSRLDEKILNTAVYKVSNQQAVTGFLATQQRLVLVHTILGVSYTINSGPDDLGLSIGLLLSL